MQGWQLYRLRALVKDMLVLGRGLRSKEALIEALLAAAADSATHRRTVGDLIDCSTAAELRGAFQGAAPGLKRPRSKDALREEFLRFTAPTGSAYGQREDGILVPCDSSQGDETAVVPLPTRGPLRATLGRTWTKAAAKFFNRKLGSKRIIDATKEELNRLGRGKNMTRGVRLDELRHRVSARAAVPLSRGAARTFFDKHVQRLIRKRFRKRRGNTQWKRAPPPTPGENCGSPGTCLAEFLETRKMWGEDARSAAFRLG